MKSILKPNPVALFLTVFLFMGLGNLGALQIYLDYRYDNGYFSQHPERKIPLEYCAHLWESVLVSERSIPAGTTKTIRTSYTDTDTQKITWSSDSNAFVIFIYAYDFADQVEDDGSSDASSAKAIGGYLDKDLPLGALRINTKADRPWFFDATPQTEYDVPVNGVYDLITTGVHEIGHVLGFLRAFMDPFVKSYGDKDERFAGPAAMRANGGQPVPLNYDSSHIRETWWNDNYLPLPPIDRHVMHTYDPVQGYRQLMTRIDLAILEDIGWDVDYDALPSYPYTLVPETRLGKLGEYYKIGTGGLDPVGLWRFDYKPTVGSPLVGLPVRYSPPAGKAGGVSDIFTGASLDIKLDAWLYCVPRLAPSGQGGSDANRYSIAFDVFLPSLGPWYCLYNASPTNSNDGEFFIKPDGSFGSENGGYSSVKLQARTWYRLLVVVDADKHSRRYYLNGSFSHQVTDVSIDGRYALNSVNNQKPWFLIGADNDGEDGEFFLRSVVLYGIPLTEYGAKALGGPNDLVYGLK